MGVDHNFMMECLNEKFKDLIITCSLSIWAHNVPQFVEVTRHKNCHYCDKGNNDNVENVCLNENPFSMRGLLCLII